MPKIGMLLYGTGFILMIIGDRAHKMSPKYSGEPLDWGTHGSYTVPIMLAGCLLLIVAPIYTLIVGLVYSRKNRSQ